MGWGEGEIEEWVGVSDFDLATLVPGWVIDQPETMSPFPMIQLLLQNMVELEEQEKVK